MGQKIEHKEGEEDRRKNWTKNRTRESDKNRTKTLTRQSDKESDKRRNSGKK